jgi:hypothetical protein
MGVRPVVFGHCVIVAQEGRVATVRWGVGSGRAAQMPFSTSRTRRRDGNGPRSDGTEQQSKCGAACAAPDRVRYVALSLEQLRYQLETRVCPEFVRINSLPRGCGSAVVVVSHLPWEPACVEATARRSAHLERVVVGKPNPAERKLVDPRRGDQLIVIANIVPPTPKTRLNQKVLLYNSLFVRREDHPTSSPIIWMMCGSESLDARQQPGRIRASKATSAVVATAATMLLAVVLSCSPASRTLCIWQIDPTAHKSHTPRRGARRVRRTHSSSPCVMNPLNQIVILHPGQFRMQNSKPIPSGA